MHRKFSYIILIISLLFIQCGDDNPIPNESELITSVNLRFIHQDLSDTVMLSFQDLDGDGGLVGIYKQNHPFKSSSQYVGTIEVLNEAENPAEDITLEIQDEQEVHQFFYLSSDTSRLSIKYDDLDANQFPVGLKTKLTTGLQGVSSLRLLLLHEPDKSKPGVREGNPSMAGGDSDIDINFQNIKVE